MSRRSTRLSATLSSSGPSSAASASGSRSSPGALPATSTRRRAGAGKERRFEDILADAGDETRDVGGQSDFVHHVQKEAPKRPAAAPAKRKAEEPARKEKATVRRPRKTYGEEKGEDDFIFSRTAPSAPAAIGSNAALAPPSKSTSSSRRGIPGALGAPPSSDAASAGDASRFTSRTRMEPMPMEEETPIIRRNQALRAGLGSSAAASSSSTAARVGEGSSEPSSAAPKHRRRDSMGLKTTRRVSSLSNGAMAHPHESVPFSELFRHASTSLPDAQRMRTLVSWILRRGVEKAKRGEWEVGKGKKKLGMKEEEREKVKGMESVLEKVMEETLEELERGRIDVDWNMRARTSSSSATVHPRNVTNAASATRLEGVVGSMAREVSRWEAEERSIEAFEAETARLLSSLDSADSTHEEEWQETDLDGEAQEAWNLANKTLASEAAWLEERKRSKSGATQISEQVKAVEAEIRHLAASSSSSLTEEVEGTQRDARFGELEFNVDRLHSLSHSYVQLSALASRYVSAISLRAANALQAQRSLSNTGASSSSAAASSSNDADGAAQAETAGGAAAKSREDVERLLARLAEETEMGDGQEEEEDVVAEESAGDLLAALVGKRR